MQRGVVAALVPLRVVLVDRHLAAVGDGRIVVGRARRLPFHQDRVGQQQILLVVAQANRYEDTVALFTALGGGWWNRQDVAEDYATMPPPR